MKTKLIIFILVLNSVNAVAQEIWPTANLEAYVGTWVYQKNDTVFKITLQKSRQTREIATYDVLLGGYSLSVGGVIVENYMKNYPLYIDYRMKINHGKIYIWSTNSSSDIGAVFPNELRMIFYDQRKQHFKGKGLVGNRIKLLSPDKIHWKLDEERGIRLEAEITENLGTVSPIGFSVPSDVIMTKEK